MEPLLVRIILWLKKTDLGLAFLLGLASWIVLAAIDSNFPDGVAGTIAWRILSPEFKAGSILVGGYFPITELPEPMVITWSH
jgi:hypothetical protein